MFLRSLVKAKTGGYTHFVVSELALHLKEFESLVLEIKSVGLIPVLQLSSEASFLKVQKFIIQQKIAVERWITDQWPDWQILQTFLQTNDVSLKIVGVRSNPCLFDLKQIPQNFLQHTEFYFPYQIDKKRKFRAREIIAWREKVKINHPSLPVNGPSGIDIYEPRIQEELELEPCHAPLLCTHPSLEPKVSVVIPTYNNGLYLLNTLQHLERQTLPKDQYEVVVVDDGSCDKMSEGLLNLLADFEMPLRVLYYPRMKPRKMGDNQFRAGLARNYGVKFARGKLLVFLDSDILTPPNFLERTLTLHEQHDVVQWRREYFHKNVSSMAILYADVQRDKHCFIPEGGYWHQFYDQAEKSGWTNLADHWKYACTYGFSMQRSLFKEVGWFRKTFCFYGLEDTDLGWRLANRDCSFHLEQTPVYHLYHETARSEFFNSSYKRQKLLKTTSEIFFYNNLSPDIYRVFQYLLNSWIY